MFCVVFLFQILDLESQSKSKPHIELSYSLPVFPSCSLTIFNSLTISYNLTQWGVQPDINIDRLVEQCDINSSEIEMASGTR